MNFSFYLWFFDLKFANNLFKNVEIDKLFKNIEINNLFKNVEIINSLYKNI